MKTKLIFILFFSSLVSFSQKKPDDSITVNKALPREFIIGIDMLNAGLGVFSDNKTYQGYLSSMISDKVYAVLDGGYGKNKYDKSGYLADASGFFIKAGGLYMLSQDAQNKYNGFYAGPKIGASFYKQEYHKVPIRGYQGGDYYDTFPGSSQSSYWLEAGIGGRVQLFESRFYIDVQVQPRYLIYTTKQENIEPMIIPGFGKSSSGFNMGFSWNLAYQF